MPYKLLLADDSVTIQRVIELTFADEDITVTAVGDGDEAADRIVSDRPDIILADVDMPGRDGYEIASLVKGDPDLARIPVVLLTGAFEPVDEARARSVRCDAVLSKPFDPQVLIARVRDLLVRPATPAGGVEEVGPSLADQLAAQETADGKEDPALDLGAFEIQPAASAAPETSLDDYFDRLDAAFAHLTGAPAPREGTGAAPSGQAPTSGAAGMAPAPGSVPVSDAFTALLSAEQRLGPEGAREAQAAPPAAPVADDAFIDEVARRVGERLADAALRESVAQTVSATAERLVREEIERLKNSIK